MQSALVNLFDFDADFAQLGDDPVAVLRIAVLNLQLAIRYGAGDDESAGFNSIRNDRVLGAAQRFQLTARLLPAGGPARAVPLRGCGQGCFTAPLTWATGDNVLTLRAAVPGWAGATTSLLVPWPVQPAGDRLTAAVAALRAAGPITVYEQVTSDTSRPLPAPTPLHLTCPHRPRCT